MNRLLEIGTIVAIVSGIGVTSCVAAAVSETVSDAQFLNAVRSEGGKLQERMPRAEDLASTGQIDESKEFVLETFPENSRTGVQKFLLANTLFDGFPRVSYGLHREAALAYPDQPLVQYEWAIEQHRARRYADALVTYQSVVKKMPDLAAAFGLAAECALRTGDAKSALASWNRSKEAQNGTVEEFESLVCEINGKPDSDQTRSILRKKISLQDRESAISLICQDSAWKRDWWNSHPDVPRLQADLSLIRSTFNNPPEDLLEAICLGDCRVNDHLTKEQATALLMKNTLLLGADARLPSDGRVASQLVAFAVSIQCADMSLLARQFRNKALESARATHDSEMYNLAWNFADLGSRDAIDKEAWDQTHDSRFAESLLQSWMNDDRLKIDSPVLKRALDEFPDSAEITLLPVLLMRGKSESRSDIIRAILAQYRGFSSQRNQTAVVVRPSSDSLFWLFERLQAAEERGPNDHPTQ